LGKSTETGFLARFSDSSQDFGEKPGFWESVGKCKETRFLTISRTQTEDFGEKPGFWSLWVSAKKPGFWLYLGLKPRILERNRVSGACRYVERNRVSGYIWWLNQAFWRETRFLGECG